ncbi:MAG: acyl-phosphate glycerol 3-phosphate acyltransferase [Nitrosomonadaceae bacterium]|nr:acyl-phosphate glycerol 3-phosphate acyltransferase [Nitrosomonadaceae bacterium]|tara:strand:+ start:606 stop:1217 length:612 start_codon:yes stop_codon:yes gene_type:complete
MTMTIIIFAILAYLIGSISFAVIASWIFRLPDPRTFGSMNPGATNVLRSGNKAAAIITLLGDISKGWLAIILAQYFVLEWGLDDKVVATVALLVFLGHIWSIFLGFKGGRGVATAIGVVAGLSLWLGILATITWSIVFLIWRFSSLSALVAAMLTPVYAWIFLGPDINTLVISIISLLVIWRHKSNITNLIDGKETKIGKEYK